MAATARTLSVVGAPTSAGAYGPGQERAPSAFRRHGLHTSLESRGLDVVDRGDGRVAPWRTDETNPTARNADIVAAVAVEVADSVAAALEADHDVLVLGGDCTIELGVVAGAIRDGASVGLAYVDLDTDLNTPETGDGVLDWMGVAHLLDVPGVHDGLAAIGPRRPLLDPAAVRFFAAENITAAERAVVDRLELHVEPLVAVVEEPDAVADRTRAWAAAYDRILVHVDIDVLDYTKFPIAEEVRDTPGLELSQLARLLQDLWALPNRRTLTLSEINPDHAPDERASFDRLVTMVGDVLGRPANPNDRPERLDA
jgi:arginase